MIVTAEQEVAQIQMGKPHVVILGAGASLAACPKGDRQGKPLPLMNNFVELLNLARVLDKSGIVHVHRNFEDVYSELFAKDDCVSVRMELEREIYQYFSSLQLPDNPTLYDHLVLSLRDKDVIATFNWDPFLVQAFRRNCKHAHLPRLLFLHGNVLIGYCEENKVVGLKGSQCSKCRNLFTPTRLLYPIAEKNYEKDGFIAEQWRELGEHLKNAYMVSIFGYGAPKSDSAAIELLKNAWGITKKRSMEEIEMINLLPEDELVKTWRPLIHSHHYSTTDSFYSTWIANHPRRTGEAYINQFVEALYIEDNPIPKDADFPGLWAWIEKLVRVEQEAKETDT